VLKLVRGTDKFFPDLARKFDYRKKIANAKTEAYPV
jgi:hypothetical protein